MAGINWDDVEAKQGGDGGERLQPGIYAMRVLSAEDNPIKGHSNVFMRLDIASGDQKNYYLERGWDGLAYYANYDEDGIPDRAWMNERFKHMFECMEASTPNKWKFDGDVHNADQFKNCLVGVVLREAEYEDRNTGEVKTRLEVGKFFPTDEMDKQKPMKKRELKGKRPASNSETSTASSDYIPF